MTQLTERERLFVRIRIALFALIAGRRATLGFLVPVVAVHIAPGWNTDRAEAERRTAAFGR